MFDLKDAYTNIDIKKILNKVSECDIWRKYCSNFDEINKPFLSELYNDKNPSCRIYYNKSNKLIYKDHGTEECFDCFGYIQAKYHCNFQESLKIVYNDFKLGYLKIDIIPQLVLNNQPEELKIINKPIIDIVPQAWTLTDYNYWNKYEIPLELLNTEEVYSCSKVYLHTNNKTITYYYKKDNPIYAYKEYDIDLNFLGYRIYFPLAKKGNKWLNSSTSEGIQGIKSIKRNGGILGITKSRKDILCYRLLGIETIAPSNESGNLDNNRIYELFDYYDFIFINFDPDERGIKSTIEIYNKYAKPYFYTDKCKDLSDFIEVYGLEQGKVMINNKLKQII